MPQPVLFSWSGGKDSALALEAVRETGHYEIVALLTTLADAYRRISHHGVREELLQLQAEALDLPLKRIYLPVDSSAPCTNERYEAVMEAALLPYRDAGVLHIVHGDLFLADLRAYRERNLAKIGMHGLFPLWGRDTRRLIDEFIERGYRAYLCSVDAQKLGESFAGRPIDERLVADLPAGVDPCGEYGEYHSFVYDGPIFRHPVAVEVGQVVLRDDRYYADLLPAGHPATAAPAAAIPPIR